MQSYSPTDVTSLTIQLNELRSKFDYTVRQGNDFADLRNIYDHIKELECHIDTLEWDADKPARASKHGSFPLR